MDQLEAVKSALAATEANLTEARVALKVYQTINDNVSAAAEECIRQRNALRHELADAYQMLVRVNEHLNEHTQIEPHYLNVVRQRLKELRPYTLT